MVTLASSIIRGVATTVTEPDREIDNPTASNLLPQVVTVTPAGSVTLNTTDDAFQVLSDNTVAFKTDLPATTTKQINVLDVLANQYPVASPVTVSQNASTFTMSNGLLTVTVRKTMSLPSSPLAPVASIVPATGTVQFTGSDHLNAWSAYYDQYNLYDFEPANLAYTFEVLEQGPLVVKVKATYTFTHTNYMYGLEVLIPSGSGTASEIIELRAGVNAVFFENASDYPWLSGLDIANLNVNQLRYRGHNASTQANGYVTVSGVDARYDSNNATHRDSRTAIKDISGALTLTDYLNNPFVPQWDLYIANTGRWLIARNTAGTGRYVGIMAGGASRGLGTGFSGVKYTGNGTSTKIIYACNARTVSGNIFTQFRYSWALTVCDEPVLSGNEDTTIPEAGLIHNQQINATLTKLLNWQPASSSETFSSSSMYFTAAQQAAFVARVQASSSYATDLRNREPNAAALINYIETPTSGEANALYDEYVTLYEAMINGFWHNNGYNERLYRYWMGALEILRKLPTVSFLMARTDLTPTQKTNLYKIVLFFGHLMSDEDFVPFQDPVQWNYGNANEILQYLQQKESLQLYLFNNPDISAALNISSFVSTQITRINAAVSAYGSSSASPHYTGTFVPTMNLVQQAYSSGLADLVAESPRLTLFGNWLLDILTPEDSRFGNLRKMIAFGDGSLEGTSMHGQMGTILYPSNPTLSARLMEAWDSMDAPHDYFYQSSVLKIDDSLPTASLALTDAHYPDYMSVFRSGFGTANESAAWFLHGDFFSDHRNYDTGAMSCYLLGKPIVLSWSSFNTPKFSGSLIQNGLTLVSDMTWDGTGGLIPTSTNPNLSANSIDEGSPLFDLNAITYTPSSTRPQTVATFDLDASTTWTRTVMLNKESVTRPVVVIRDEFAGTNASAEKVLSLNLMMTGAVVTPGGNVTPSTTANRATSTSKTALASGWTTFEFTGQWGVNIILMVYNVASANYQLGRLSHTYSPSTETAQYLTAVGSAYEEMQYQFRLWSTANSRFVLVPWLASGSKPTVTSSGTDILVDGVTVT